MNYNKSLLDIFHSLSEFEKKVFTILLISNISASAGRLFLFFNELEIYSEAGVKNTSAILLETLESLRGNNLLKGAKGKPWTVCNNALFLAQDPYVRNMIDTYGGLIIKKLEKDILSASEWEWGRKDASDVLVSLLQPFHLLFALPLSRVQKVAQFHSLYNTLFKKSEMIFSYCDFENSRHYEMYFWHSLADIPEISEIFSSCTRRNQKKILEVLKMKVLQEGEMIAFQEIASITPKELKAELLEVLVIQGKIQEAEEILNTLPTSSFSQGVRGIIAFLANQDIKAEDYFHESVLLYKKENKKRKYHTPYLSGVFHVFLMIKKSFRKNINKIHEYISTAYKNSSHFKKSYAFVECIAQNEEGEAINTSLFSQKNRREDMNVFDFLWCAVAMQWCVPKKFVKEGDEWSDIIKELQSYGFHFLADQIELITKKDSQSVFIQAEESFEDQWRHTLNFLDILSGESSKTKTQKKSRIAWVISLPSRTIEITPKLQVQNKNGSWSKGRNIALSKLKNEEFLSAPLSVADRKIIQHIKKYNHYDYYGGSYYQLDAVSAIVDLKESSSVFNDSGESVDIQDNTPKLHITKSKKGYTLSFSEDFSEKEGVIIQKRNDRLYSFQNISYEHLAVKKHIKKNNCIPFEAEEALQKMIFGLSQILPLHSDLAGSDEHIKTVEADTVIQAHIERSEEKLRVEFFIEPIPETEHFFHPGKGSAHFFLEKEGEKIQTARNLKSETQQYNNIIHSSFVFAEQEIQPFVVESQNTFESLELLDELKKEKNTIKLVWKKGEEMVISKNIQSSHVFLQIKKSDQNWFELSGNITQNKKEVADIKEILAKVHASGSRFLEFGENEYWALSEDLHAQLHQIEQISDNGKVNALTVPLIQENLEEIENVTVDDFWKENEQKWKKSLKKKYKVPSTLQAELRAYQKEGFEWLAQRAEMNLGACLADDMGLGKTLQSIALLLYRAKKGPALVVAPVSVLHNWKNEIEKFAPSLRPILLAGTPEERSEQAKNIKKFDVLLCSYGILDKEKELLGSISWDTVILDEAQAIKNHTTKRSQAAFALQANFKMITTGTPIENHLSELWSLFRFITPGFLGSFQSFTNRFILPLEKDSSIETQKTLQKMITPFVLRRKKHEVLTELPEKTEITLSVDMSDQEKNLYEALRQNAIEKIEELKKEKKGTQHLAVLAQIMNLRKACCHPSLVNTALEFESSKLKELEKILTELQENKHKVLIFSQFVEYLKIIKHFLEEKNISYQYLDGSTPLKKRKQAVEDFQDGQGDCFLISLKAGGSGLNLTAANYVIHMDPWWNPAVEDQASDRVYRIGQKQKVTVYRLIIKNSIEEKILNLHSSKRDLADGLLNGTGKKSTLSLDQLKDLLKGE